MVKPANQAEAVLALAKAKGILRARDLTSQGIPREILRRLCESGKLTRTGRGLYVAETENITENHTLAEVARLVPRGIVCLLSALRFHGLPQQTLKDCESVYFLQPQLSDEQSDEVATVERREVLDGLHTKLFVIDHGWEASVFSGSFNATVHVLLRTLTTLPYAFRTGHKGATATWAKFVFRRASS